MLAIYASDPNFSRGRLITENPDLHRTPFQRDRDRILHSAAFRRLQYKTQVFVNHEGDHYRTRLTHSLEVAQIARSISKILNLCEDLSETVALAHDMGHAPFGHAGEDGLKEVMLKYGGFDHNAQTLKLLTNLESRYAKFDGLNLSWESLEGITKHNGPLLGKYSSKKLQNVPQYILNYSSKFDLDLKCFTSLEAQVASISDDIAYNNHDLEDGVRAGLVTISDIETCKMLSEIMKEVIDRFGQLDIHRLIHEITRRTVRVMIYDVIKKTQENISKYSIASSDDVRKMHKPLVEFSQEGINLTREIQTLLKSKVYRNFKVNKMTNKAKRVVRELFHIYMDDPRCLPPNWLAKIEASNSKNDKAGNICDFIAGMTDRFALKEYMSFFDLSHNESLL